MIARELAAADLRAEQAKSVKRARDMRKQDTSLMRAAEGMQRLRLAGARAVPC